MRRITTVVALAVPLGLGLVTPAAAGEVAAPMLKAESPIAALLREAEASELGPVAAYEAYRDRVAAFAEETRGTEDEVTAKLWLIKQCWWLRSDGTMQETAYPMALDLLERHSNSPQLGMLVEYQYVFGRKQRPKLYDQLLEVSPHTEVRASAHFGYAKLSRPRERDGTPNTHLATLIDEYADVPWRETTFGAIAQAYLNPHAKESLVVGQSAPEITGKDHKGQAMQLSDFRGKVVMLDFWGHW